MPDRVTAGQFLDTLNSTHPSLQFTMEVEREGSQWTEQSKLEVKRDCPTSVR